ncbi:hypothetical protein [Sphingomonas sp. Root710]|uniref:hypothetical protein n=1 Tax=Sphingomonas sp. Root710 TaxID=1736594 RepID=UPI001F40B040|nr:hypothetical protein [Sphingomonas sp. Root710]
MALSAAPIGASTGRMETAIADAKPVDWLYPEIPVDDEGWRGLLPVILLDTEAVVDKPAPKDVRSERK